MDVPTIKEALGRQWEWPMWPFLPVKRNLKRPTDPEIGVIWNGDPLKIYKTNVVEIQKRHRIENAPEHYQFESVDQMMAEGWIVD